MARSVDREARRSRVGIGRVLGMLSLLLLPLPIGILVDAMFPSRFVAISWVLYILIVSTVVICVIQAGVLVVVGHLRALWSVLPVFGPLTVIGLLTATWGTRGDLEMSLAAAVAGTTVFVAFQSCLGCRRHPPRPEAGNRLVIVVGRTD